MLRVLIDCIITLAAGSSAGEVRVPCAPLPAPPHTIPPQIACSQETGVLQNLDHPNIVRYYHAYVSPYPFDRGYIVMELAERGSLHKLLHKNKKKLEYREVLELAIEIAEAMAYLHSHKPKPVVHGDIKSQVRRLCFHIFVQVSASQHARGLGAALNSAGAQPPNLPAVLAECGARSRGPCQAM